MRVSILFCLAVLLTACGGTRVIEKPVPVEVVRDVPIPIPDDLTRPCAKQDIPDGLTYGGALEAWVKDRACVDILNANMKAIETLD